jgi:hypothetical protein
MICKKSLFLALLILILSASSLAQSTAQKPSKIARRIGIVVGAVGGLALAGAILDDDKSSSGEFFAGVLLLPPGGGVAGYYVGRAIDRRGHTPAVPATPLVQRQIREELVQAEAAEIRRMLEHSQK